MPFKLIRKPRTRPSTRVEFQPTFAAQARFRDGFSLIAALGFFLVAASVAAAADPPPNHDRAWWSNSPPSDSSEVTPKATEYGPATAASSTPQSEKTALLARTGQTAEGAPDLSGFRHSDVRPVAFQQESPAGKGTFGAGPLEKAKPPEPPPGVAVNPLPTTPSNTPASASSSPAAQGQPAVSLGLGSRDKNGPSKSSPLAAVVTVGGSLAIVLGLFFVVAWAMRKTAPRGSLLLPKEVFEILGRAPLGARQQVQLLRCGNKLLLVSITAGGTETLTEVTDPLEVDRLAGICYQANPKSATTAFRQIFQQLAPKWGGSPEIDAPEPAGTRRKRFRWEEKNG